MSSLAKAHIRAVAVSLTLALVLVSCADDGSDAATSNAASSTTPTTTTTDSATSTSSVSAITSLPPALDTKVAPTVTRTAPAGEGVADRQGRLAYGVIMEGHERSDQLMALYAVDVDGTDLVQLTDGNSAFPAWSPDGARLAFGLLQPDGSVQIATIAPDGTDLQTLTSGPGIHSAPSWSPDGSWIAYEHSALLPHEAGFGTVLYRIDADGTNPRPIADNPIPGGEPKISPDGRSVLYQRFGGPEEPLVIRDLESGEETIVLAAGGHNPTWSPDGTAILVQTDAFTPGWIWGPLLLIPVDEASDERIELHQPTATSGGFKPVYSPDGRRIAFGCGRDARTPAYDEAICVMNADGTDVETLIDTPRRWDNEVSWGVATADL